tara:strand:- start:328 stop:819 length:492 start_codon:yes stop_codon:yes gene_type:complete
MKIYLILFLFASFSINADELDVFFEALNKDYLFNEIVYGNELPIQKSNGEIIKKMNQFEVHIKHPFEESYYVSETEIDHIDHDLDQKQTIPIDAINSPLIKAFLSSTKKHLDKLDIEIIDNLYLFSSETQTIEFLTKDDQIKKIIFLDNLGYRHEITMALKHG